MNEVPISYTREFFPLSVKDLWRDSTRRTRSGETQPTGRVVFLNPGRQQQAAKENYLSVFSQFCTCALPDEDVFEVFTKDEDFGFCAKQLSHNIFHASRLLELGYERRYLPKRSMVCTETPDRSGSQFFEPMIRLDKQGRVHAALDLLYERIDQFFRRGRFADVDSIVANTNYATLSTNLLVGLLTATLPAKSKLPSRAHLFRQAESLIKERREWDDDLLTGLEP